jgi:DNA-directed RNA polymerase sigma subunit (sigma70/sigma32)
MTDTPRAPRSHVANESSHARIKPGTPWAALPERYRFVVAMRERGASFAEIGRQLGVTRQRAAQMWDRAQLAMHPESGPSADLDE